MAEYEEGRDDLEGDQPRAGFWMQAPNVKTQFFECHEYQMQSQDNYYLQTCEWVSEQVGGV